MNPVNQTYTVGSPPAWTGGGKGGTAGTAGGSTGGAAGSGGAGGTTAVECGGATCETWKAGGILQVNACCAGANKDACGALLDKTLAPLMGPVPLIVWGSGNAEKDNEIFPAVAEAAAGENCLIGTITEGNYKTLTAVCTAYKHKLIAESPCDVNIAKQVNILAQDMGFSVENIVIYPTSAALGYGLEYIYSVMERARLAGLKGDRMLAQLILCDVGIEAWGVKEARVSEAEIPEWGALRHRAPLWEAATAGVYLICGGDHDSFPTA